EHELSEQPEVSPDLRSFTTSEYPESGEVWLNLWDMATGARRDRVLIAAPGMHDQTAHVSPDGRLLLSQASDPEGNWEFAAWEVGDRLERRASFKTYGEFSPDRRWCAERERTGAVVFESTCPERRRPLVGTGDADVLAAASVYDGPSEPC